MQKQRGWLPEIKPKRYLAIDIAAPSLAAALSKMAAEFSATEMVGLATDFSQNLSIPSELLIAKPTLFYPGSSIGNFAPDAAIHFLRQIYDLVKPRRGGLLIGVDAKKEKAILDAAYDDALGVTAAFNLNALRHINRVLACDFDLRGWRHIGFYNEIAGRVEMHLESLIDQCVTIRNKTRQFAKGDKIHSENSYKYERGEFETLLTKAGFQHISCWTDQARAFGFFMRGRLHCAVTMTASTVYECLFTIPR